MSIQSPKACSTGSTAGLERSSGKGDKGGTTQTFDMGAEKSNGKETHKRGQQADRTAGDRTGAPAKGDRTAGDYNGAPTKGDRSGARTDSKLDLPVLRHGAEGKQVGLLQKSLSTLGYEGCRPDGNFGRKTAEATLKFQIDQGLKRDGIVGHRETWPAINQALTSRHDGLTRLSDAMGTTKSFNGTMGTELKQLGTVIAEFSDRTNVRGRDEAQLPTLMTRPSGEIVHINRTSESLIDVSRLFGVPVALLLANNPDIEKPYLILPGQEVIIPRMVKDRDHRKPPRQLHPADPEGHLAHSNMNPDFVKRVNAMIGQLRGEGFDIRLMAGFRTFSEQQIRFEQGRTTSGLTMTDRAAGHSWHNYGLAIDAALNDDEGNPAWPEDSSAFWQRLGDVALAHGCLWGGTFGYPSHVEYHPQCGKDDAGDFIDDFESHGLDAIWQQIVPSGVTTSLDSC
ncbi:MAG: peptidoglycan-binding protein [Geminicoccales bacterium]